MLKNIWFLRRDFISLYESLKTLDIMIQQKNAMNYRAGRWAGIASVMLLIVIIAYAVYECKH